jgi:hypothetical protein
VGCTRRTRLEALILAAAMLVLLPPRAGGAAPLEGAVRAAAVAAPSGYWLTASDGGIFAFGDAGFFGSTGNIRLAQPVVGMAASPTGQGYWLVASDGGIFAFGDARFFGSTGNIRLAKPIVGMASTTSGRGYWLVASDGGIFAFGDARFHGSTGAIRLNRPIVAMAPTPTGGGYWLVASDGGIFSFGDAAFFGSASQSGTVIAGMASSPSGRGYWLASRDGRIFAFGDAAALGAVERLSQPIVGLAPTPSGGGSWLVAADGGIFSLGDARFFGSTGRMRLVKPIVGLAAAPGGGAGGPASPVPPLPVGTPRAATPFKVGLIGDTGYSAADDEELIAQRARMNETDLAFITHNGDIQKQGAPCTDARLEYVKGIFDGFKAPFVFTPGDNEYTNCSDPAERLAAIRRIFYPDDRTLGQNRMTVQRQAAPYVENARWERDGVWFATLNVPDHGGGIPAEANIEWLNGTFDAAEAAGAAGVMITWQADDAFTGSDLGGLTDALEARTKRFGRPVVLVHGDGHSFTIDNPWPNTPNLTRVETWFGSSGKWVECTVDASTAEVFTFKTRS